MGELWAHTERGSVTLSCFNQENPPGSLESISFLPTLQPPLRLPAGLKFVLHRMAPDCFASPVFSILALELKLCQSWGSCSLTFCWREFLCNPDLSLSSVFLCISKGRLDIGSENGGCEYPYPVVESIQGSCGLDVTIKIWDYFKLILALGDRGLLRVWFAGLQAGHRSGRDSLLHRNHQQIFTECFGLYIIISKYLLPVPVEDDVPRCQWHKGRALPLSDEKSIADTCNFRAETPRADGRFTMSLSPTPVKDWRCSRLSPRVDNTQTGAKEAAWWPWVTKSSFCG